MHFLLQENREKLQGFSRKEISGWGLFLCSKITEQRKTFQAQNYIVKKKGRRQVRIQPNFAKRLKTDYENFKESFIEDLKADLYEKGLDVSVKVSQVDKMNESYEAITVTPEGSNIGVNLNMEKFFEAYENGTDFDSVVAKASDVIEGGLNNQPTVDVASKKYNIGRVYTAWGSNIETRSYLIE